jgi:hypothetical protein
MSQLVLKLRIRICDENTKSLDNIADKSIRREEEGIRIVVREGAVRLRDNLNLRWTKKA